jgi:hypothetical protein
MIQGTWNRAAYSGKIKKHIRTSFIIALYYYYYYYYYIVQHTISETNERMRAI